MSSAHLSHITDASSRPAGVQHAAFIDTDQFNNMRVKGLVKGRMTVECDKRLLTDSATHVKAHDFHFGTS